MSAECGRRGRGGFCCARRTMRRREKFAFTCLFYRDLKVIVQVGLSNILLDIQRR